MNKIISTAAVLLFLFFMCPYPLHGQITGVKIKQGDIIEVRVYGHEELSKTIMVQSDGTVNYPLVSDIPIDGLQLDEFREVLVAQATKYLGERPIVTVRFSQIISVHVTVLGQVSVPGEYLVAKTATVQGAITQAGGFTPRAQLNQVKVIRKQDEEDQTIYVDMYQFYTQGDPDLLPELKEGDIIVVPGVPGSHDVKVMGEVKNPGTYTSFQGANFLDLLYMAGGPTEEAHLKKIRLISPLKKTAKEIEINLDHMLQTSELAEIPSVQPGDIIYVPQKSTFWKTFVSVIQNVSAVLTPILLMMWYYMRARE
ncbi:MAG: SLBB domain-containing protein [bacterium]